MQGEHLKVKGVLSVDDYNASESEDSMRLLAEGDSPVFEGEEDAEEDGSEDGEALNAFLEVL